MKKAEKIELAEWAVGYAEKCGADDVSVTLSTSREIEVEFRRKQIDKLKESTQNSLNLSIYAKKRYSGHRTNNLKEENLKKFIEESVSMTSYLKQDPFRSLPDPKFYKHGKDLDLQLNDPSYQEVNSKERIAIAREIEAFAMKQSKKIISVTSGYSDTHQELVKVHSNGFLGTQESTRFSAGAEATVRDEDKGRPEDWFYATVRFFKDLPDPEWLGKRAVVRALEKIGQGKIKTGVYDIVVENRAASRLLVALYVPMTARAIQQKSSFLEGKIGKQIGSKKLTVIDDPFIPKGLGSRLFDEEGLSSKQRVMVEKGILREYYVDDYYGKKLKLEPTTEFPSNIILKYGTKALDGMVRELKKGIVVTGFIGGNSNPATGDFSFGIVGKYVEDGRISQPVNEMNITGNLEELWKGLVDVGNDPYLFSSIRVPALHFEQVNFSGR